MDIEQFIERNIELIDNNEFAELYNRCYRGDRGQLTDVLYECGINPLRYMTAVPQWFAFESNLTNITIPNRVTNISRHMFENCHNLTSVTIPDSVTSIGGYAFYCCTGLTKLTMGSGVTSIGELAFGHCRSLTNVVIPDSVTSIGEFAFGECGTIQITYTGTKQQWEKLVKGKRIFVSTGYTCNCIDGVVEIPR